MRQVRLLYPVLLFLVLSACARKKDPSVATSGGGVQIHRNVMSWKGAAR